nr:hypothetical protein [Schwartzia sp. (in: firmicutes)]
MAKAQKITIEGVARKIRAALKNQKTYSKDLELAIQTAAGTYVAYTLAVKDIEALESTFYKTYSREGNPEYKEHPAIKAMERTSNVLAKRLKALGLTLETLTATDDDPLEDLVAKVREIRNSEDDA